jgi:hypothetical protein
MRIRNYFMIPLIAISLMSCQTLQHHTTAVDKSINSKDRLTLGKVQREIRIGMSSAAVVETLGPPNIVTLDSERREVWTYDRVATYHVHSSSSGGVNALILGGAIVGGGALGGGGGAGYGESSGASATTQKSLTIIIKYDKNSLVRDFAYRSSTF